MLTALPFQGWAFTGWSVDASGNDNPLSITMNSSKAITATFTATASACARPSTNLKSWWPGAGNGNDIVGTNNGVLEGVSFPAGKVGQSFSFDGSGSAVTLAASPDLKFTTQFTLEAWINPTDVTNYRQIFSAFRDLPYQSWHYQLGLAPSGALRMDISANNTTYDYLVSTNGAVTNNTWAHVAATFNAGVMKLYVNGTEIASTNSTVTWLYNGNTTSVYIGTAPQGNQRFSGLIDEMSVYNRPLTATEIQAIYTAGSAGKCLTPLYITSVSKRCIRKLAVNVSSTAGVPLDS